MQMERQRGAAAGRRRPESKGIGREEEEQGTSDNKKGKERKRKMGARETQRYICYFQSSHFNFKIHGKTIATSGFEQVWNFHFISTPPPLSRCSISNMKIPKIEQKPKHNDSVFSLL